MSKQIIFELFKEVPHNEEGTIRVAMDRYCDRCRTDRVTVAGFDSSGTNEYVHMDLCANCLRDVLALVETIESM